MGFTPRYNAAPTDGTVLKLNRGKDYFRCLPLVDVIGEIAKFILKLPKIIMNALIVSLPVAFQAMKILEKMVDIICNDDTRSLGWWSF